MHEEQLFTFLDATGDAAFSVDEQGVVRSWNRAAERLFGYRAADVLGRACADITQGHDVLGAPVCGDCCDVRVCALAGQDVADFDLDVKNAAGQILSVNISTLVFRDSRSGRRLLVHLARDARRRRETESLLRTAGTIGRSLVAAIEASGSLPPMTPLTAQERRILQLLAEGKASPDIARQLDISPRTLRSHIHHVNQKLHARSRLEAVIRAIRRGLIEGPTSDDARQRVPRRRRRSR